MITPRAARPEDAGELVRLRRLMYLAMDGRDRPGRWERDAEEDEDVDGIAPAEAAERGALAGRGEDRGPHGG
ncbi:GNAT family N-acetyltransferase, partial [Streptomyces noursei]